MLNNFKLLKYILSFGEINKLPECDILFLINDVDRSFKYKRKFYSPIADTLNEEFINLNYKTLTIATPFSNIKGKMAFGNVFTINGIWIRNLIINKLYLFFSINLNIEFKTNIWKKILRKVEPKIIFGIQPTIEVCKLCKSLGIVVFDIQHGVISEDGIDYYNFKSNRSENFLDMPDIILCWDLRTCGWICDNFKNYVGNYLVGNLFNLRFFENRINDSLIQELNFHNDIEDISIILFTTDYNEKYFDSDIYFYFPENLYEIICNNEINNVQWWIRIHPVLIKKFGSNKIFSSLEKKFKNQNNVFWLDPTFLPLPFILKRTNLHLTHHSAVTIEASWYGIKTGLFHKNINYLRTIFEKEFGMNLAFSVLNSEINLIDWIKFNINNDIISNDYFTNLLEQRNYLILKVLEYIDFRAYSKESFIKLLSNKVVYVQ